MCYKGDTFFNFRTIAHRTPSEKGVYSKGSKFFPFRVNPFPEGRKTKLTEFSFLSEYPFSLKVWIMWHFENPHSFQRINVLNHCVNTFIFVSSKEALYNKVSLHVYTNTKNTSSASSHRRYEFGKNARVVWFPRSSQFVKRITGQVFKHQIKGLVQCGLK